MMAPPGTVYALRSPDTGLLELTGVDGWPAPVIAVWESPEQAEQGGAEFGLEGRPVRLHERDLLEAVSTRGVAGVSMPHGPGWRACTRLSEVNHDTPTALLATDERGQLLEGMVPVIRRSGVSTQPASDFWPWERWDILDAVWGPFLTSDPWLGYVPGEALWTLTAGGSPLAIAGDKLLGPWFSPDGTRLLATEPRTLKAFWEDRYQGPVRCFGDPDQLAIVKVEDLAEWLLADDFLAACSTILNPGRPRGFSAAIGPYSTTLVSVSGEFKILPGNRLERQSDGHWTGYSTIRYSGGPDRLLLPLTRSFTALPLGTYQSEFAGLTQSEVEEVLPSVVAASNAASSLSLDPFSADAFAIHSWETLQGETGTDVFANALDAVAWLKAYEQAQDRPARIHGASSAHWDVGIPGNDKHLEADLRGAQTQRALDDWLQRIAGYGYTPADADTLVRIVNATFTTVHVECAGFVGDLLWQLQADADGPQVLCSGESPIALEDAEAWIQQQKTRPLDPSVDTRLRELIGDQSWSAFTDQARFFIATALMDYDSRGSSPLLDYAPVVLGLVKALEVELNRILQEFRDNTRDPGGPADTRNEQLLASFFSGGTFPSIGQTRHLLSAPDGPRTALLRRLLTDRGYSHLLTSRYREGLAKTVTRYRNRGVHSEPLSLEDCDSAIRHLLTGDHKRPGLIAQTSQTQWPGH